MAMMDGRNITLVSTREHKHTFNNDFSLKVHEDDCRAYAGA